ECRWAGGASAAPQIELPSPLSPMPDFSGRRAYNRASARPAKPPSSGFSFRWAHPGPSLLWFSATNLHGDRHMRVTIGSIIAAVAFLAADLTLAQTQLNRRQERELMELLAEVGASCERISRTQAIGQLDNRDTLMAVACTSGEQYVILLDRRARMEFYSTCEAPAAANKIGRASCRASCSVADAARP